MTFVHPWVLIFLILPIALGGWEAMRRGHRVAMPFDYAHHPPRWFIRRVMIALIQLANFMPALLLAAAIVLLAGPSKLGASREERVLTNVELCLDVSGSMSSPMGLGGGPESTRYTTAMEAIKNFTSRRRGDAFGLTIFGSEVVRWVPLTTDLSAIQNATPFLDPASMPPHMGGTRIGHALEFANHVLSQVPEGDRLIILISDGQSSDLGDNRARQIGSELADSNIVLHMINVGGPVAPAEMFEVASPTGGQVFNAQDQHGLTAIFEHIDRMQKVRIKPTAPEPVDWFTPAALAGLAALALHQIALFGLRYTPW